jgi:hypothetical protein
MRAQWSIIQMMKQIFLFGFPRSGTTLIRSRISQHPDIYLVNEPELIFGLRNAGYKTNDQIKITGEVLQQLGKIGHCKNHLNKLDGKYVEKLFQNDERLSLKNVYEKLLPKPQKVKIWGEKSLNNGFFLKELSQLYPDSLFIKIIRDPRSCILSKFKKKRIRNKLNNYYHNKSRKDYWIKNTKNFARHAASWSAWYQITDLEVSKYIEPNNLINLRYEDFINQPKIYLNTICNKLGISFDEKMIDYDKSQQDQVLLSKAAYAHQNITKKIDRTKTYSYKEMAPSMVWVVEKFASQQMRKYGYGIENPNLSAIESFLLRILLKKNAKNIETYAKNKLQGRFVDSDLMQFN